jgi:hypothetical protein
MKIGIISIGMIVLLIASAIPAVTADKLDPSEDSWIEIIDATDDACAKIILKNFDNEDEILISIKIDQNEKDEWTEYDKFTIFNQGDNGPTIITIGPGDKTIELDSGNYPIKVECDGVEESGNIKVL